MSAKTGMEGLRVEERRKMIIDLLHKDGRVRVNDLGTLFKISEVTIRNDLIELEKSGLLERTHGGALPTVRTYYNMDFYERTNKHTDEKKAIAAAVAGMIENGQTIMINSGTTTYFIAHELRNHSNLKIVTNSISIAQELGGLPNLSVILLGGNINVPYSFTYGFDAVSQLKRYRSDLLILSVDGISANEGLTTYHYEEADIDRNMIERVNRTVAVADFSKIGRECFSFVDDIGGIDCIVTNQTAPKVELDRIASRGIDIITV